MNCPSCQNQLSTRVVSGLTLDVCDNGCGGIWFDHFEFKKFEDPQQPDVETLLKLKINPSAKVDKDAQRKCPKCQTYIMMKHFASVNQKVMVDECPKCAGIWLDASELHQIHGEYNSEAERAQAAEKVFNQMFGPQMAALQKQDSEKFQKMEKFGHALRFICPSYYVNKK